MLETLIITLLIIRLLIIRRLMTTAADAVDHLRRPYALVLMPPSITIFGVNHHVGAIGVKKIGRLSKK